MFSSTSYLFLVAASLFSAASAHSWNEQLAVIGADGKYVGGYGYPRGYVARTDPGYTGESMKYILPAADSGRTRVDKSDLLCHPSQRIPNQPAKYPRLQVAPGSAIAMKYLENGHVTIPSNQPGKPSPSRGAVYVFGTTQPSPTEKLTDILQWTKDGSGGNGKGRLLGANNFDDGRCHQINDQSISKQRQTSFPDNTNGTPQELWCETDIVLPKDITPGKPLTVYWVWDWPTAAGTSGVPDGKDEYYTTCSDLDVVAKAPSGPVKNQLTQQDPMMKAVSSYKNRPAQNPLPRGQKPGKGGNAGGNAGAGAEAGQAAGNAQQQQAPPIPSPSHPAGAASSQAVPTGFVTSAHQQSNAAATPAPAAANPAMVQVNTKLAPGHGILVGKDGKIFNFDLPVDGGAGVAGQNLKVKLARRGVEVPEAAMEVAGGSRFRMPRGGRRQ